LQARLVKPENPYAVFLRTPMMRMRQRHWFLPELANLMHNYELFEHFRGSDEQ
jgi:hypothetical protein